MEFLVPILIMVFLNLFLIFRLLYMASRYAQSKNVRLIDFSKYNYDKIVNDYSSINSTFKELKRIIK